jgi:hypothetical protein
MEGVWGYDKQRSGVTVKVEMFGPVSTRVKRGIEAEAKRLGDFFGNEVKLTYAH